MSLYKFIVTGICIISMCLCSICLANTTTRDKSQVLLIINNISESKYSKALNKMMDEELHKKINGIYEEKSAEKFLNNFKNTAACKIPLQSILSKIDGSSSDYLIYAELKPFNKNTEFNFVYYDKEITATFAIRIIDIKNKKELYKSEYSLTAKDSTDYFFIGSGSVSKKALEKVLYRAGEAISVYLPL